MRYDTQFDNLDHAQLVALTEPEKEQWINLLCAEEGIAFLPPVPTEPVVEAIDPDVTHYRVGEFRFLSMQDAEAVAAAINSAKSRRLTEHVSLDGRSYGYPYVTADAGIGDDVVRVSHESVFSQAKATDKRDALRMGKELQAKHEAAKKEYKLVSDRRAKYVSYVRDRVDEAHALDYRRERAREVFGRYVSLANGNRDVAAKFFWRAEEDLAEAIRGEIPDRNPADPMPLPKAESVEELAF